MIDKPSETEQVQQLHWALAAAGLADLVWGHAALRSEDDLGVWTKAAGWAFEEIGPDQIVKASWTRNKMLGEGRLHIELPIHLRVLRQRPDLKCTVHTHAPAVAAFASLGRPLHAISHDGVPFAGDLPCFEQTANLIDTDTLGDQLAHALGEGKAVLIPQHGMVTAGASTAEAVMLAVLLERACRTELDALAAGGPKTWSDDAEVRAKMTKAWPASQFAAGYAYLVRAGRRRHLAAR